GGGSTLVSLLHPGIWTPATAVTAVAAATRRWTWASVRSRAELIRISRVRRDRDGAMDPVRQELPAEVDAFDPDLLDDPTRAALGGMIQHLPERELRAAKTMLDAAFAETDTVGATMLYLVDKLFAPHLATLGDTCATLLDLVIGQQMQD